MVTRRAGGDRRPVIGAAAVSVSTAVVVVAAVGGAWTVWNPGLLKGPAVMDGSARGTALALVAVALPALVVSMLLAARGVHRAVITWLSALLFVAYNSVLLLFMTPFNAAFLVYVAMLSTSAWALWTLVSAGNVEEARGALRPDGAGEGGRLVRLGCRRAERDGLAASGRPGPDHVGNAGVP